MKIVIMAVANVLTLILWVAFISRLSAIFINKTHLLLSILLQTLKLKFVPLWPLWRNVKAF